MTYIIKLLGKNLKKFEPNGSILTTTGRFTYSHIFVVSQKKCKRFTSKKAALRYIEIIKDTLKEYKNTYEEKFPGGYYRLLVLAQNMKVESEV